VCGKVEASARRLNSDGFATKWGSQHHFPNGSGAQLSGLGLDGYTTTQILMYEPGTQVASRVHQNHVKALLATTQTIKST